MRISDVPELALVEREEPNQALRNLERERARFLGVTFGDVVSARLDASDRKKRTKRVRS